MSEYLPQEVREGLETARKATLKRKSRMRVRVDGHDFHILRIWNNGFSLDVDDNPKLRGLVDLYKGEEHVSQCLIVATEEQSGEMRYEYKRQSLPRNSAPLDFVREDGAPAPLMEQDFTEPSL